MKDDRYTSCVNFIHVLVIIRKLCGLEFFKTVYLKTSNVQFRTFPLKFSHIYCVYSSTGSSMDSREDDSGIR